MKIQQQPYYQNSCLWDKAEGHTVLRSMQDEKNIAGKTKNVDVAISEEGIKALQKWKDGFEAGTEEIQVRELELKNTNELAWEHYTAMRDMSSMTLKDGNYNLEDVMKSMLETYETQYHQIVKEHEDGERQVSYELTGKSALTLEEDLAGLDAAFEMRLANLKGYITCQQTNKAFENPDSAWFFRRNTSHRKEVNQNHYLDKAYQDTAVSIMKKAQKNLLAFMGNPGYKKGASTGILFDVLYKNENFMDKTRKLFS